MLRYFFSNEVTTQLDPLIDEIVDQMNTKGPDSSDYPALMDNLKHLYELKAKDRRPPVSRDTIVLVAGNVLITLIVVAYEHNHVWTSKAKDMLIRPR